MSIRTLPAPGTVFCSCDCAFRKARLMSDNTKRGIVFAAILLVILYALGLRIDHPKSGLKNALGTAESSVAIYWHKSEISVGDKVLVTTKIPGKSPKLALVNNVNTDYVDVQTGDGFERVTRSDVRGSLVMIFPFLGTFLGFVGL